MKHTFSLLAALFITVLSYCQTEIKLEDASKHVGDSVKVCGKVAATRYLENVTNQPTFLNLGAAYPNQLLTIVIWNDVRKKFEKAPDELFKDKEVCVTGRIELFRERPQIVIGRNDQISLR